jgi:hypothetical protein
MPTALNEMSRPRRLDDGLQMVIDSALVGGVHLRGLGGSTRADDAVGDVVDRRPAATGEEEPSALVREAACDSTADRTRGPIDDRDLGPKQHLAPFSSTASSRAPERRPS